MKRKILFVLIQLIVISLHSQTTLENTISKEYLQDYAKQISQFGERFGSQYTEILLESWKNASMVYPVTKSFHYGSKEMQWDVDKCVGTSEYTQNETGFHDINLFISILPHPETRMQSVPEYVKMLKNGGETDSVTPIQVSEMLHSYSNKALTLIDQFETNGEEELEEAVKYIKATAYLGKYYAYKIQGAVELQKYRELSRYKKENQMAAVEQLTQAGIYWKMYAALKHKNADFEKIYRRVMDDLTIAKGAI